MPSLSEITPDFDLLVSMKPHELAPVLLRLARDHLQNGMFTLDSVGKAYSGGRSYMTFGYDGKNDNQIERILAEGCGIMAQTPQAAGRWYNETASWLLFGLYISEFAANPKVDHFGMDCCRFAIGDSGDSLRFKCFC
jgi:hypothetical protein